MSYRPIQFAALGPRGFGETPANAPPPSSTTENGPSSAALWAIGAGLFVLVGMSIYFHYKLTSHIVRKHGVGKALAFEAGTAAIGVAADRMRRNPRRRRSRRRR